MNNRDADRDSSDESDIDESSDSLRPFEILLLSSSEIFTEPFLPLTTSICPPYTITIASSHEELYPLKKFCPGGLLILYTTYHRTPGNVTWNRTRYLLLFITQFCLCEHAWSQWCVCRIFVTVLSLLNRQNSSLWGLKEMVIILWHFSVWKHCQHRRVKGSRFVPK